jgi:hypothetical protein
MVIPMINNTGKVVIQRAGLLVPLEHLQQCSVCDPAKMFCHPSLVILLLELPLIVRKLWIFLLRSHQYTWKMLEFWGLEKTMMTNIVCGFPQLADFGSCRGVYSKQPYTEYISTRWCTPPMSWIFPLSHFVTTLKWETSPRPNSFKMTPTLFPFLLVFAPFSFVPKMITLDYDHKTT